MFKRKDNHSPDVDLQAFAEFNQKLFFNPDLPPAEYKPLSDAPTAHILPVELQGVLDKHFKANKSSGLSPMPLQLLKNLGKGGVEQITNFINSSAID